MSPRPQDPSFADRNAYIPPSVQAAMSRQMQQSVPANLRKYVGDNRPTYIPQHVEQALKAHMQKALPAHMQQYAGAYVQQNIMEPSLQRQPVAPKPLAARPPVPDRLNQSHSGDIAAEQANARFLNNLFQSDSPQPAANQPGQDGPIHQPYTPPEGESQSPYEFFMNPAKPSRHSTLNFGGGSAFKRTLVLALGVLVLLMIFMIVKGLLAGNNQSIPELVNVAQEQQLLVHIAADGTKNAASADTKNFAYTAQLSIGSEQSQLVAYLQTHHRKVTGKELNFKLSSSVDDQLGSARDAGTYDATFNSVMQSKLQAYQTLLKQAYNQTTGSKARALLNSDFQDSQLLLKQLSS